MSKNIDYTQERIEHTGAIWQWVESRYENYATSVKKFHFERMKSILAYRMIWTGFSCKQPVKWLHTTVITTVITWSTQHKSTNKQRIYIYFYFNSAEQAFWNCVFFSSKSSSCFWSFNKSFIPLFLIFLIISLCLVYAKIFGIF